jgi:23S rRNA (adenine2503-C2)-methyltransferase
MLDQVMFTQADSGLTVSHIVLMGIGEPLDNFDNVMRFLELVNSEEGMNISMRHISLSTCGLVPKIDQLAQKKLQISLAISLHGPNNEKRSRVMPVNKAYPIEELLDACRHYYDVTGRRIHFEYAMIDGLNDTEADARELLRRLKGLGAHVNLIPLNHVEESPFKPSSKKAVARFQQILEDGGVTATVRRTLGGDIDASCGQLRRKQAKESAMKD